MTDLNKIAEEKFPTKEVTHTGDSTYNFVQGARQEGYIVGLKEIEYWKQRCEAAEKIVRISGVVACEGYEEWKSLAGITETKNK